MNETTKKETDKSLGKAALYSTLIALFLAVAVTASIILSNYLTLTSADRTILQSEEQKSVELAQYRISAELAAVISDIAYLSDEEFLQDWLADAAAGTRQSLAKEYLTFMRRKNFYDQIRFIDENGREVVRVNQDIQRPRIIPDSELQDKASRYYFTETLSLDRNQIYVSPLDLNIENNVIEQPIKPVIRIGTPVFDHQGNKRGVIILNFRAGRLLAGIRRLALHSAKDLWLLNEKGYWLIGPSRQDEWAFMYPDRQARSFSHAYPAGWNAIAGNRQTDQFTSNGDLFTYTKVFPAAGQKAGTNADTRLLRATPQENWILLSHVPADVIAAGQQIHALRLGIIFIMLTLMQILAARLVYRHWMARLSAELAADHSEAIFRTIATNVADAVIAIDPSGRIESFNASAEQAFGYSAEEVIGRNVSILMPEPYRFQHGGNIAKLMEGRQNRLIGGGSRELAGLRKDGSIFPLELAIAEASVGDRQMFIGAARDISIRKANEKAIRESEERFRVAFDSAPHGIALVGLDGQWLKVNRAIAEMLGYDERELLATDFQTITHPDDLTADLDLAKQVIDGEIPNYQMEKRYIRKDGQIVPALLSVSVVRDASGAPVHFVSQLLDLTERNEIGEQLIQAQKMEAVGQLTGGIAHDFNNLLTVILGNARLLERRLANGDAAVANKLDAIVNAARRGSNLTQRLLAFSRKEKLEPKLVDGPQLVTGMLDMMRRTLGETIEIKTHYSGGPLNMMVDPNLLEAALLNLATNARDAMPDGGTLTIELGTACWDGDNPQSETNMELGDHIVFTISDTGTGIAAEDLDRIFEPFFTTKDVGKGSGLGLSMVFGFVKQSGGHIQVESTPGNGTTLRIYLPRSEAMPTVTEDANVKTEPPTNANETILVVEDEPGVRAIAVAVLEELGYHVVKAENGPDALAKLDRLPHLDLLFTDIVMPGNMTGLDLAEKARKSNPDLKVLFTTGYASGVSGTLPKGIAILNKPYEAAELAVKISQSLEMAS
jgi:PAS domain S-box-containing protein